MSDRLKSASDHLDAVPYDACRARGQCCPGQWDIGGSCPTCAEIAIENAQREAIEKAAAAIRRRGERGEEDDGVAERYALDVCALLPDPPAEEQDDDQRDP